MASNIDPTHPVEGPAETQPVRDNFKTAADEITELQAAVAMAMPKGGGTMEGPLYLNEDPAGDNPLQAATKHYVDNVDNMKQNTWGVTDGSEAPPGDIGAYQVMSNTSGVTLPSNVPTQICALSLTPGDYEIWGAVDFQPAAGVSPNMVAASVSVHPDALPTDDDLMTGVGILNMITTSALTTGQRQMLMTGQCRSNSSTPLDLYLVAQTTLGGSGLLTAKGYICSRRMR